MDNFRKVGVLMDVKNMESRHGVYYSIMGLDEDDVFISNTVDRMVTDTIKKISGIIKIQTMSVHFKKHKPKGDRSKYSVRIKLMTDKGLFNAQAWDWDARSAVDVGLDKLETIFLKSKEKAKTKRIKKIRQSKNNR